MSLSRSTVPREHFLLNKRAPCLHHLPVFTLNFFRNSIHQPCLSQMAKAHPAAAASPHRSGAARKTPHLLSAHLTAANRDLPTRYFFSFCKAKTTPESSPDLQRPFTPPLRARRAPLARSAAAPPHASPPQHGARSAPSRRGLRRPPAEGRGGAAPAWRQSRPARDREKPGIAQQRPEGLRRGGKAAFLSCRTRDSQAARSRGTGLLSFSIYLTDRHASDNK